MNTQAFAVQLREEIRRLKDTGIDSIDSDNLISYLDDVASSQSKEPTEQELTEYHHRLQLHLEQTKGYNESQLEMFRAVIVAGQNAIRSSFLLNGGAAVALLAFVGHLAGVKPGSVSAFSVVIVPFAIGVLFIAVTSGLTYLSQWFFNSENKPSQRMGLALNIVAIILGLSSYGCFVWGMCRAQSAFSGFG